MQHPTAAPARRVKIAATIAATLLLAATALSFTLSSGSDSTAAFNDSTVKDANAFTMGTITFDVNNGDDTAYTPITAEVTDLQPGGSFYKSILVKNTGSLELRYAASSIPTEFSPLAANGTQDGVQLSKDITVDVKTVPSATSCNDAGFAAGTPVDNYGSFGGPAPQIDSEVQLIGDKASGGQQGDRVLAAGASEILCIRSSIALDAENNIQGAKAVYSLAFNAEQTANNN